MTMSMRDGSSLISMPAAARARHSGSSAMGNTTAPGRWSMSQRTVVTTVLAMSSTPVGSPSLVSFAAYMSGSRVGLFDRNRTGISRRRSSVTSLAAPGSSSSPR